MCYFLIFEHYEKGQATIDQCSKWLGKSWNLEIIGKCAVVYP